MNDLVRRLEAAAEAACHNEQMTIWSGEIVAALGMDDFLKEDLSYGEKVDLQVTVKDEIRRIIASAFEHPEALAALSAGEQMGWKPIETAPKDGTSILGFQATPGDHENRMAVCWRYGKSEAPLWMGEGGLMPTHWMPLPPAPSASSTEEGGE